MVTVAVNTWAAVTATGGTMNRSLVSAVATTPGRSSLSERDLLEEEDRGRSGGRLDPLLRLLGEVAGQDLVDRKPGHDEPDEGHGGEDEHETDVEASHQRSQAARIEAGPPTRRVGLAAAQSSAKAYPTPLTVRM